MTGQPTGPQAQARARGIRLGALLVGIAAIVAVIVALLLSENGPNVTAPTGAPAVPTAPTAPPVAVGCPPATVTVDTARAFQTALDEAGPGSVVILAPGVYQGEFTARKGGTPEAPVTICGGPDSILDGGGVQRGYVLHLDRVANVHLAGFTVRNGQKGVIADQTTNSVIQNLTVTSVGDEGIHLRDNSSGNTIADNRISDTGLRRAKFGEGVYIGSAESNWCDVSGCEPDRSDRNTITGNTITGTTAESVDIKEGTSDGLLQHNSFDGSKIVGADSWVDVKGNGWVIDGNVGVNSPLDGFQTHQILDGWGLDNVFRNNQATVNGPGYGIALKPEDDNVVECSNVASAAGEGSSNVSCSSG